MSLDIMHVFTEGTGPYELGNVLYEIINVRKLLSLEQLNER